MQSLTIGSLLQNGTYRIESVLGQGGFGITYLALDIPLQRKVAIKEFFPKDYCDRDEETSQVSLGTKNTAEFVKRLKTKFLKEARNIAKFDHPNIIRIFAAFEENNTAYYVMEYIEGDSLSSMVKSHGPLSEKHAVEYICKVGNALEYVHARKINHLDVKPANIMVRREDDRPILIDFGLSKQYDDEGNQTSTLPPGFSHGFAPIEQYNDGGVKGFSPQTDIYSLAATLYYILSGVVPLQATRRIDEDLTFPASIPQKLIAPISKAMSPGRPHRHSEVSQFIHDLQSPEEAEATVIPEKNQTSKQKTETSGVKPEPQKPKPQPKPYPEPPQPPKPKKDYKLVYIISACVVALSLVAGFFIFSGKSGGNEENIVKERKNVVTDYPVLANDGTAIYNWTGQLDENKLPSGEGTASFPATDKSGRKEYRGAMVKGQPEADNATLLYTNGSSFEGSFKNGVRNKGKLTLPADEMYYVGTFNNDAAYNGKWYFLGTNEVYSEIVNGKEIVKD